MTQTHLAVEDEERSEHRDRCVAITFDIKSNSLGGMGTSSPHQLVNWVCVYRPKLLFINTAEAECERGQKRLRHGWIQTWWRRRNRKQRVAVRSRSYSPRPWTLAGDQVPQKTVNKQRRRQAPDNVSMVPGSLLFPSDAYRRSRPAKEVPRRNEPPRTEQANRESAGNRAGESCPAVSWVSSAVPLSRSRLAVKLTASRLHGDTSGLTWKNKGTKKRLPPGWLIMFFFPRRSHPCERHISRLAPENWFTLGTNIRLDSKMDWSNFGGENVTMASQNMFYIVNVISTKI